MEPEQRGRASRASSTSSLGREVRCGCQYYQSDSLLPERRALLVRPSSRMQQPSAVRCSEHEYEPIAPPPPPSLPHPAMAPVVRITDTDVMPVADSDDSIDDRGRLPSELLLDGDVILPLDGKIEDSAMEGRELGETGGDTSEEQELTAQQFQERLEERFLDASTPYTESRTDGEINTSQVDSSTMEELPLRRGTRGLPQRLKIQAGKLRSRLRGLQRPAFTFPQRSKKHDKKATRSPTNGSKPDKPRATEKRPSRMDRLRTSISEKSAKFSLPDRPRFSLPDKSKFHLPERPKFNFPDRSKFTIKKPSIRLPGALARVRRPPSLREQQPQRSTESTAGSKRNIFDFAAYPRIFDKRSKKRAAYATSSPKDSRAESAESATFPRARKGKFFGARWVQPFGEVEDAAYIQAQERAERAASDGSPPWQRTSMEEQRLSVRTEEEILAAARAIPWEDVRKREQRYDDEEIQYMDYEQESSLGGYPEQEISDRQPSPPRRTHRASKRKKESYEREEAMEVDPRLYDDDELARQAPRDRRDQIDERVGKDDDATRDRFRPILKSRSLDGDVAVVKKGEYDGTFMAVDPRRFASRQAASEGEEEEDAEEREPSSARSDREQQHSSGSSCERRRRGVIEEIDSDEFFLRESGISQDDMNLGGYLTDEIRNALRSEIVSALQDDEVPFDVPPQRPARTRSLRRRKEDSMEEPNEVIPPIRPKRKRATAVPRGSREASVVIEEVFRERTRSDSRSDSRHRVVYQTEGRDQPSQEREPPDDIVVVKPARRKSRSSLRSQSQPPMETPAQPSSTPAAVDSSSTPLLSTPPGVPLRKKRSHRETTVERRNGDVASICNGYHDWEAKIAPSGKSGTPRSQQSLAEQIVGEDGVVVVVSSRGQEDIEKLSAQRLQRKIATQEAAPVPPKRRSRSRTSVAADEDRTSHGAESLPEIGYVEEDIPRDEASPARDLPDGYATVEKREKPPRPPPPRKRRNKFATTPRPVKPPKRPQRAYSTLGPATRSRPSTGMSDAIMSETISSAPSPTAVESTPYIEIDSDDDGECKDALRGGGVLDKIQGRPLPAPPRPPRARKEHAIVERPRTPFEFATTETTTATQTDPLPDDMVIEEEITQAKLTVMPSRSGSQVTVSMERISSPSRTGTPPVPPLPMSQFLQKEEQELEDEDIRIAYDTVSLSPTREIEGLEDRRTSARHTEEHGVAEDEEPRSRSRPIRSSLLSDEPLRIGSLEVSDLKVDRLSVSQIEAHKIMASEVDAMVIATSELRGGGSMQESFSPAIIRELMAIRSHLETVATSQARETYRESEKESASCKTPDIPTSAQDDSQIQEQQPSTRERSQDAAEHSEVEPVDDPATTEDKKLETDEDQKVVKTNVLDVLDVSDEEVSHIFSVAQVKESSLPQTLAVDQLESKDKYESTTTHLLTVIAQDTEDKSLRILDSEHLLTLSVHTTSDSLDESRASFPSSSLSSDVPESQSFDSRASPERKDEPPSNSVQTTTAESTATTTTSTTTYLRGSKDDVSENTEQIPRKSRSRSSSLGKGIVRQTASPVRSLPPAISVTPDTPDPTPRHGLRHRDTDAQPQRAVISYSSDKEDTSIPKDTQSERAVISHSSNTGQSLREEQRESSQSPISSLPFSATHFIAFPASEIPAQFFSLNETPTSQRADQEPGIIDTTQQLLRALRSTGIKAMRHFVMYLTSTLGANDREKVREVELAICALLLLIVGLLIYYFSSSRTVTHHHHWDYFNPPQ